MSEVVTMPSLMMMTLILSEESFLKDGQTDRQTDRQTSSQAGRQARIHAHTHTHTWVLSKLQFSKSLMAFETKKKKKNHNNQDR